MFEAWQVWASLRERFGNPRDAAALDPEGRAAAIRERRGLVIERSRDGFGGGDVSVRRMRPEPPSPGDAWSSWVEVWFAPPAVISDEELEALAANPWESWNDLPGLP